MWHSLSQELEKEVAYCTTKSTLYHDIFAELLSWTEAIRSGDSDVSEVSVFKSILESQWAGKVFHSWFERPLLLTATLHRLVLAGRAPSLARFYAAAGGEYVRSRDHVELRRALADVIADADAVSTTLSRQTVQTNEISRGVTWLLPYLVLNRQSRRPCILVELGCSGGLNLLADRYGWEFAIDDGGAGDRWSSDATPVISQRISKPPDLDLVGALRGLPEMAQLITRRLGCDLSVPDLTSTVDLEALSACIWGDDLERFNRLREAAARLVAYRAAGGSLELSRMDLLEYVETHIKGAIAADPPSLLLFYNSVVTTYLSGTTYDRLRAAMAELFRSLPQHRGLWIEHEPMRAGETPGDRPKGESYVRLHTLGRTGALQTEYIGSTEMHPKRVAWFALRGNSQPE